MPLKSIVKSEGFLVEASGLTLSEVSKLVLGPAGKKLRAAIKDDTKVAEYADDIRPILRALATSHEFLAAHKEWNPGSNVNWALWSDPVAFFNRNSFWHWDLEKYLKWDIGVGTKRLTKDTSQFLREWVNTDGGSLPHLTRETLVELKPFRAQELKVLYRGIRFNNIGQMVRFHREYGEGKPFKFQSERATSWSTSKLIAERFGRYSASSSQGGAMLDWLHRVKDQKDYSGKGGFLIGARVPPKATLVDLSHPALPPFGFASHGSEGEVIILPDQPLTAKVYGIFGDAQREIDEYLASDYENKSPNDGYFFSYIGPFSPSVSGDTESGVVSFTRAVDDWYKDDPPDLKDSKFGGSVMDSFESHLYDAEWVDKNTVRYKRMKLSFNRVARNWLKKS